MTYDLLVSGPRLSEIRTYPFLWLAKIAAWRLWWPGAVYFSITKGRTDIIWRRDMPA